MKPFKILSYLFLFFVATLWTSDLYTVQAKTNNEQSLVDHATLAVQDVFNQETTHSTLYKKLNDARAVMICPNVTHISLVFGGSGGQCVLLSRDAQGSWSSPAFYSLSSGSFGIQMGVQNSTIILFIMNDTSLRNLLDSQFTMGADATATAANSNGSADTGISDIYTVQKSSGLFIGASLKGSKLKIDSKANYNYYNSMVGPEDIVMAMRVNNSNADPLRRMLIKLSNAAPASTPIVHSKTNRSDKNGAIQLAPSLEENNQTIKSENLPPPK